MTPFMICSPQARIIFIYLLVNYGNLSEDLTAAQHIVLKGHVGPVTSLMHPSSNIKLPTVMTSVTNLRSKSCLNLLQFSHVLWSGGDDYTIRVWNIKTEQMLCIFHCHSAPILSLKLHHLPINYTNVCGFSQGFTGAMFNTIHDNDEQSYDIKQMINVSDFWMEETVYMYQWIDMHECFPGGHR